MDLRRSFQHWVRGEIGSTAVPALRRHMKERDYRLFSRMEHAGRYTDEVFHPGRGFYRATGSSEREALLGILRQIWLVDALSGESTEEIGPAPGR